MIVLLPPLLQQQARLSRVGHRRDRPERAALARRSASLLAMPMARLDPRISMYDRRACCRCNNRGSGSMSLGPQRRSDHVDPVQRAAGHRRSACLWVPMTIDRLLDALAAEHARRGPVGVPPAAAISARACSSPSRWPRSCDTQATNYARMVEYVSPYNRVLTTCPRRMGAWSVDTASRPRQAVGRDRARQSIHDRLHQRLAALPMAAVLVIPLSLLAKAPRGGYSGGAD